MKPPGFLRPAGVADVRSRAGTLARIMAPCLVLAGMTVAAAAHAQVYKCEQGGKITYSDAPCASAGGKSNKLEVRVDAAPALSESANIRIRHYDVTGRSYNELVRSIMANGPKGFHGMASWKPSYTFRTERQGANCRISSVDLRLDGEILMPRWIDSAGAPADLVRRWETHYAALMRHEEGHIQHGREFGVMARRAMMGLPPLPCEEVQSRIDRLFADLLRNFGDRDKAYDRRTNHGETQGAVF